MAAQQRRGIPVAAIVAMRPKQWLKNLLVFAAPLAAGSIFEPEVFWPSVEAFVAFCLYFFRDPERVPPDRPGMVLAPADGHVVSVAQAVPPRPSVWSGIG